MSLSNYLQGWGIASENSSASTPDVSVPDSPVTAASTYGDVFAVDANSADEYVMVTGGLGYIGSHTTLELLKAGYNVLVVDNLSNSFEKVLDTVKLLAQRHCDEIGTKMPKVQLYNLDYRSDAMKNLLSSYAVRPSTTTRSRIIGVIHFAAFKSVEESISAPLDYYDNNVCGLVAFVKLLQEFEIRNFVFSSSATVYGDKTNKGLPLHEDDLVHHPLRVTRNGQEETLLPGSMGITSPYGRTKYFSEAILADLAYADPKWKITALRYFNPVGCHESGILGEDPRQKPTNLFPVIGRILTGESKTLNIFGSDWDTPDGTAIRDFIHIVDLARGHVKALAESQKGTINEAFRAYNLGTGRGASVQEVVNNVEEAVGCKVPVVLAPRRAGDVGYCVAATKRVEEELKWTASIPLEHGARDMWNFLRNTKMQQEQTSA